MILIPCGPGEMGSREVRWLQGFAPVSPELEGPLTGKDLEIGRGYGILLKWEEGWAQLPDKLRWRTKEQLADVPSFPQASC